MSRETLSGKGRLLSKIRIESMPQALILTAVAPGSTDSFSSGSPLLSAWLIPGDRVTFCLAEVRRGAIVFGVRRSISFVIGTD